MRIFLMSQPGALPAGLRETSIALLAGTSLFCGLGRAELEAIAARLRPATFAAGQLIFARHDHGRDLYLVIEGRVRLSVLTSQGRELALGHAGPGEIFGEFAVLDGQPRTADATAIAETVALSLPKSAFANLLAAHSQIAAAAIRFLCTRLRETTNQLEAIALHSIEVRLARFLLSAVASPATSADELHSAGRDRVAPKSTAKTPASTLDLGMSQSELAMLVGASRQKVNAALMLLEEAGAVTRAGARFTCHCEVLREIAQLE